MDAIDIPLVIRWVAFLVWIVGMAALVVIFMRQLRLMRIKHLLKLKRRLAVIVLSQLALGLLPLIARWATLQSKTPDPLFTSLASLAAALSYAIAGVGWVLVYWLKDKE